MHVMESMIPSAPERQAMRATPEAAAPTARTRLRMRAKLAKPSRLLGSESIIEVQHTGTRRVSDSPSEVAVQSRIRRHESRGHIDRYAIGEPRCQQHQARRQRSWWFAYLLEGLERRLQ
jgi:hypothetical protein